MFLAVNIQNLEAWKRKPCSEEHPVQPEPGNRPHIFRLNRQKPPGWTGEPAAHPWNPVTFLLFAGFAPWHPTCAIKTFVVILHVILSNMIFLPVKNINDNLWPIKIKVAKKREEKKVIFFISILSYRTSCRVNHFSSLSVKILATLHLLLTGIFIDDERRTIIRSFY